MSSHREAPEISKDPVADNTDVYAFVSPDRPDTVTLIANYIPLQKPDGGPNFYEFGDDVRYEIHVSNRGDARADVTYRFRFTTIATRTRFCTTPRRSPRSPTRRGTGRSSTRSLASTATGTSAPWPAGSPCRRSTSARAAHPVTPTGSPQQRCTTSAAGAECSPGNAPRASSSTSAASSTSGRRPFQHLHLIPSADAVGVNGTQGLNVHTIAVQVPITDLTRGNQRPTDVMGARSVIGIWASASRQRSRILDERTGRWEGHGPFRQVSRLGNPLFNEVIVPMARKDRWNHLDPDDDKAFATYVLHPELAGLLPVLYPGVFPNLAAYTKPRADLAAVLLTGIPSGVVPGFQNFTGTVQADMLRLNVAVPPTEPAKANPLGLIGGDAAGFPNGRRVFDDVVTVELRAVAGATIPLVDPSFTPDGAATVIKDGTSNTNAPYLPAFPLPRQPRPVATRPPPACPPPEVPDAARRPQPAGQGHVLLDIGGSIGALLVHMPAAMAGDEIEATPTGASAPPQHVAVIARRAGEHVAHIAVFPALPEGTYQVHRKPDGPVRLHTTVEGGRITETRWPENNQH